MRRCILRRGSAAALCSAILLWGATAALGATVPAGFTETLVASGLTNPTAMQFAPDGRLFVCEQAGRVRVIKNGVLLSAPFATLNVTPAGERGLLGIAFDPQFATNHFVYVYYTATSPVAHNRISRLTANGDVAVAGSEVVLFELDNLSSITHHNGGDLEFGPDGKLYAAVGENQNGANAQTLTNVLGKMLRLNRDGTIPTDNPFYGTASGRNRAIWALGLRNPYTFAFNPGGTEMLINDVGESTWEEIDDGVAGANYGWPQTEGMTTNPAFKSPRFAYAHTGGACAITGGAFYSPLVQQFPSGYVGDYFFADFCAGWIRKLELSNNTATTFATGIASPIGLKVSDDGALYYLARGSGTSTGVVYRISYSSTSPPVAPHITTQPASRSVTAGSSVTFSVRASGTGPLRYQWQRNGSNIAGATSADLTLPAVSASDNGARFRAIVANDVGSATSTEAVLTVTTSSGSPGTGSGLAGVYYDNRDFTGAVVIRLDPTIDFRWASGAAPLPGIGAGTFSVRWTGRVEAVYTETYRFYTYSDDGVRLWVNGQLLVDNWTDHPAVENSGTIALVAGQRYDIRLEYFQGSGPATARLSWSSRNTSKGVIPANRLYPDMTRINFQLASAPVPAGYRVDSGLPFGARGGGLTYGWTNDNTGQARDRNAPNAPDQRYDTLIYMQKPVNPNAAWEMALPNGKYAVRLVAGDPSFFTGFFKINAETTLIVNGAPTSSSRWVEGTAIVTVSDGRLTLTTAAGGSDNKVCFVHIVPQ